MNNPNPCKKILSFDRNHIEKHLTGGDCFGWAVGVVSGVAGVAHFTTWLLLCGWLANGYRLGKYGSLFFLGLCRFHCVMLWGGVLVFGGGGIGCANPVQPQGGEKDTTAPVLMSIENTPTKGKTRIRLVFNENIQATGKVLASPIILNTNTSTDTNQIKKNIYRNTITLTLPKHVETIYLNAFVKDLNEGNSIACPTLLIGKDSGEIFIRVLTTVGEKSTYNCFIKQGQKIYLPENLPNNIYHFSGMGNEQFYTTIIKNDNNNFLIDNNESYLVFYSSIDSKDTIVASLYPINNTFKTAYIDSLGNAMVVGVPLFYEWLNVSRYLSWSNDTLLVKKKMLGYVKNLLHIDTFFKSTAQIKRCFNDRGIVYRYIKTQTGDTLYFSPTNNSLIDNWWVTDTAMGESQANHTLKSYWDSLSPIDSPPSDYKYPHLPKIPVTPVFMQKTIVRGLAKSKIQDVGVLQLENPNDVGVFFKLSGTGVSFIGYIDPNHFDSVSRKTLAGTLSLLAPEGEYSFYSWINNTVAKEGFHTTTVDAVDFKTNRLMEGAELFFIQQKPLRVNFKLQNTVILPEISLYSSGIIVH